MIRIRSFYRLAIATALAAAALTAIPAFASASTAFTSPTGNIRCAYGSTNSGHRAVECISKSTHRGAIVYRAGGSSSFHTSRVFVRGWTLGYGQYVRFGSVRCDSSTVGVTCQNLKTGDGFFVSTQRTYAF